MKKTRLLYLLPAVAVFLLSLYAAIGFLAVPAIVKSQAGQLAFDKLQRRLTIAKVDFNPFTLALTVHGFKLTEPRSDAVFASFDTLILNLSAASLLRLAPIVQQARLDRPYVHLLRSDAHAYNIDDLIALAAAGPPSTEPARYSVNNIEIEGGRIAFDDKPAHATHDVTELRLGVPFLSAMPADVHVFVEPLLSAKINGAPLLVKGKAHPFADIRDMNVELKLDDVDLTRYVEYLPFKPRFKLPSARLSARLTASFRQPAKQPAALVLGGEAGLKRFELAGLDGKPLLKLAALDVKLGSLDVLADRYQFERLSLDGLDADLVSDSKGNLTLVQALTPAPSAPVAAAAAAAAKPAIKPGRAPVAAAAPAPSAAPLVSLKELAVHDAALRYVDGAMRTGVEKFDLSAANIVVDAGKKTVAIETIASPAANWLHRQGKQEDAPAAPKKAPAASNGETPYLVNVGRVDIRDWSVRVEDRSHADAANVTLAPFSLALQDVSTAPAARSKIDLTATVNKAGRLAVNGTLGLAPFHAALSLDLKNIDLLPLQPYATDYVNLRLVQASVSGKGMLQLDSGTGGAMAGGFKGNASLDKLATVDKASTNDFLSWKSLAFGGVDLRLQPFSMSVDKVALADFFARIIIDPTGRLNVQDIRRNAVNQDQSLTEENARAAGAAAVKAATAATAQTAAQTTASRPDAAAAAAPLPPIRIGTVALSGGRVRFTDNFIKPNYTANLKDLGGTVAGLSSTAEGNAAVALRGMVNGAPLSIAGRINPLKRDLFLDVKADVRGMELAALSAYADKYVGYGIEKGKLSFEAAYLLDHRVLKAENRLILDQLTFGAESTNPQATRLPVRLAVALLSDRDGVIDVSVPVGGSLDDPQFSMGGLVLKIIGNVIVKTVTAPFALLGSLFGGGKEELSTLAFEPGHAAIAADAEAKLKALARALVERPGLKLDIAGRVDPVLDLAALKRIALERKLRTLKMRDLQTRGEAAPEGGVALKKDEYAPLLARAFNSETFAKPAPGPGGWTVDAMEQQMLAHTNIDGDDLPALGLRRSQAAKQWLNATGLVPAERLFIVSAGKDKQDEAGKPASNLSRADFTLR